MSREAFRGLLEECRDRFGGGFIKSYREMVTEEFYREISSYLKTLELVEDRGEDVLIRPVLGRITGKYPDDFSPGEKGRNTNEQ